jgi:predicted nucleic acid-binding protein
MHQVILDTSVLVAGVRSRSGASFALLDLVERDVLRPVLSNTLYAEWRAVLSRPEHVPPGRTTADAAAFVAALGAKAGWRNIHFLLRPAVRDPDDDHVLELAFAAGQVPIVTHNLRDFEGAVVYGVEVLTPSDYLARLRDELRGAPR